MLVKTKNDVRKFVDSIWESLLWLDYVFLLNSNRGLYLEPYTKKSKRPSNIIKDLSYLFTIDVFCNPLEKQEDVIDEIWEEIEKQQSEQEYQQELHSQHIKEQRDEEQHEKAASGFTKFNGLYE